MKTLRHMIVPLLLVLTCGPAIGQERELKRNEFYSAIRRSDDITASLPKRTVATSQYFKNGEVYKSERITTEELSADKFRTFKESLIGPKTTQEAIQIDGKSYCKEDKEQWKLTQYFCGPSGMVSVDANSIMKFYVSNGTLDGIPVTIYRDWVQQPIKSETPKGWPDIFEFKTWIDSRGRTIKTERSTSLSTTKEVLFSEVSTIEYSPKDLKIEAPIK